MHIIRHLIWDTWNVEHIAHHAVTPDEVEEVCHDAPVFSETHKGRIRVIGTTRSHRMVTLILAPKEADGTYYPVTARPASRKEQQRYDELSKL